MKKFTAIVTAIAMSLTLMTPVFASDHTKLKEKTVTLDGETFEIRYREENGQVVYAEVDGSVIERVGDSIYVDGEEMAVITREVLSTGESDGVMPLTGWIRTENCPLGTTASEYTKDWGTEKIDIFLKQKITNLTAKTLVGLVAAAIGIEFGAEWGKTFFFFVDAYMEWEDATHIYSIEHTWHHSTMSYVARIDCTYYMDEACTVEVDDAAKTIFASWA